MWPWTFINGRNIPIGHTDTFIDNVTLLNLVVLINISYADNVLENSFKPCRGQGFIDAAVSKEIKVWWKVTAVILIPDTVSGQW